MTGGAHRGIVSRLDEVAREIISTVDEISVGAAMELHVSRQLIGLVGVTLHTIVLRVTLHANSRL